MFEPCKYCGSDPNSLAHTPGACYLKCDIEKSYSQFIQETAEPNINNLVEDAKHFLATQQVGKKNDLNKPDLSLLPRQFLEGTALAFMHGEKKYGRYNYRNGMDWHRIVGAAMRHIVAFNEGEDVDGESGVSHLAHAAASIAMLMVYVDEKLGNDDRQDKV